MVTPKLYSCWTKRRHARHIHTHSTEGMGRGPIMYYNTEIITANVNMEYVHSGTVMTRQRAQGNCLELSCVPPPALPIRFDPFNSDSVPSWNWCSTIDVSSIQRRIRGGGLFSYNNGEFRAIYLEPHSRRCLVENTTIGSRPVLSVIEEKNYPNCAHNWRARIQSDRDYAVSGIIDISLA